MPTEKRTIPRIGLPVPQRYSGPRRGRPSRLYHGGGCWERRGGGGGGGGPCANSALPTIPREFAGRGGRRDANPWIGQIKNKKKRGHKLTTRHCPCRFFSLLFLPVSPRSARFSGLMPECTMAGWALFTLARWPAPCPPPSDGIDVARHVSGLALAGIMAINAALCALHHIPIRASACPSSASTARILSIASALGPNLGAASWPCVVEVAVLRSTSQSDLSTRAVRIPRAFCPRVGP
jgi:hypothetical protein